MYQWWEYLILILILAGLAFVAYLFVRNVKSVELPTRRRTTSDAADPHDALDVALPQTSAPSAPSAPSAGEPDAHTQPLSILEKLERQIRAAQDRGENCLDLFVNAQQEVQGQLDRGEIDAAEQKRLAAAIRARKSQFLSIYLLKH